MERQTIIYVVKNPETKEFIVRNRNTENFQKNFVDMYSTIVSDKYLDKNVEDIMCDAWNNDFFVIHKFFEAKNVYNRDQKVINERKERLTQNYLALGWKENPELDKVIDNDGLKYDHDIYNAIENRRNLLTLIEESNEKLKKQLSDDITIWQNKSTDTKNKHREKLKNELNEIQTYYDFQKHKIEEDYNKNKRELDNKIEEQRIELISIQTRCKDTLELENKRDNLYNEINDLRSTLNKINNEINQKDIDINNKTNSILSLNNQIEKLKTEHDKYIKAYNETKTQYALLLCKINNESRENRFYIKDYNDLLMWQNFAHEYGYDKTGIMQLRADLDNYFKNI